MSKVIKSEYVHHKQQIQKDKSCGCRGIRSCLLCDMTQLITKSSNPETKPMFFCDQCGNSAFDHQISHSQHHQLSPNSQIQIEGVFLKRDAIDEQTESKLIDSICREPWASSQSGRRKQDYGPRVNFRKRKIKTAGFNGLPQISTQVLRQLREQDKLIGEKLTDFTEVEVCNLEYCPERGSAICAHFDDFWVWGDRLVSLNLESDTKLVLTKERKKDKNSLSSEGNESNIDKEIVIELPRRSLLILQGEAREIWMHEIRREHINSRRLAITFREFSKDFLPGGQFYELYGKEVMEIASKRI